MMSSSSHLKRKRSSAGLPAHLPPDSINPRSYPPATLRQLAVAGLADTAPLPADLVRGFPHRPLPASLLSSFLPGDREDDGDDAAGLDDDGEDDRGGVEEITSSKPKREHRTEKGARRALRAQERHVGVLAALTRRALEGGDIPRARRAFGLLLRAEVYGKPVDLRADGYWAIGAEILMREGEEEKKKKPESSEEGGGDEHGGGQLLPANEINERSEEKKKTKRRRWGSAANMPRVRAYYEDLIQQFPYNRLWPRATSALTFWPALVGVELYNIYAEERMALERLEEEAEAAADGSGGWGPGEEEGGGGGDVEGGGYRGDDDYYDHGFGYGRDNGEGGYDDGYDYDRMDISGESPDAGRRHSRSFSRRSAAGGPLRAAREKIRLEALEAAREVARRMDAVMEDPPYASSAEMLRLRGVAALYMGDLAVAAPPRTAVEEAEGRRARAEEHARARAKFEKMVREGGEVDWFVERFLYGRGGKKKGGDDEGEEEEEEEEEEDYEASPPARQLFSSLPIRQAAGHV